MSQKTAPTLEDVARAAGVSTATVSRCLNFPDRVMPKTRDIVFGVVDQLGYTPHFGGRALASNRTNTVGAVIPTMENAIFARGLQAFQEELSTSGTTLLVASSGYDADRELEQVKALVARGADGLLLIGVARPEATYEFLRQRNIPYVIAWNVRQDGKHSYVGFDNREAAKLLTASVIAKGHSKIAMIAGITSANDRATDRVAGVRQALEESGGKAGLLHIIEAPYSLEAGGSAFSGLMRLDPRPSAIICGNDVLAVGAIVRARETGIEVPKAVSVVGFDDIDLALVVDPPLTTVHVPHRRMGQLAARLLSDLKTGKSSSRTIELDTQIVERGSLSKPRV